MIIRTISCFGAAALLSLIGDVAFAAQGPIYRCTQANGTLLYADSPCDGGALVEVHPGLPDPDAKERLALAQAELDRAAVLRKANEQEAARRDELAQLRRQFEAGQRTADPPSDVYYGTGYDGYGPYTQRRMQRPNSHGGGRGHRLPAKNRFHDEHRIPAVIRPR